MPGMSGFEVLSRIKWRPRVIFVTAHDEFAVRAFEEEALDYLLKPVEPARLARALDRVAPAGVADEQVERLLRAVARVRPASEPIAARQGSKITLVALEAICFIRAEAKCSVLYTSDREHVLDRTIEELERTLNPAVFLRIHRSAIVNLAFVRELTAVEGGRFLVAINDRRHTSLYASRRGVALLRERLHI